MSELSLAQDWCGQPAVDPFGVEQGGAQGTAWGVASVEARFVSVWPGDFTPLIAGSHCSAREHDCASFFTSASLGFVRSEGVVVELRRVSPICRSLGPTIHAGGIIEHFKKFNVYLILRLND